VRERCGFGCIVCGIPVYEYAHIIPFSDSRSHEAENIVLLCRNHHGLDSTSIINIEDYRIYIDNPYNLRGKPHFPFNLFLGKRKRSVFISNTEIIFDIEDRDQNCEILRIDNFVLFSIKIIDNELFLNLSVNDRYGSEFASIVDNCLNVNGKNLLDLQWSGSKLSASNKEGFIFEIDLNNNGTICLNKLSIPVKNGIIYFDKEGASISVYSFHLAIENCKIKSSIWTDKNNSIHEFGFISFGGDPDNVPVYARLASLPVYDQNTPMYVQISNNY
jgi:hypothetical protein